MKYNKVKDCVYPNKYGCRGCEHSYCPELFDGGCKLYHERVKNDERNKNRRTPCGSSERSE